MQISHKESYTAVIPEDNNEDTKQSPNLWEEAAVRCLLCRKCWALSRQKIALYVAEKPIVSQTLLFWGLCDSYRDVTDLWKACFLYFLCNCNSSDYCHFTNSSLQIFFPSLQSFSREKNAYKYVFIYAYICRYICIQTRLFFPSNTSQIWKIGEIN